MRKKAIKLNHESYTIQKKKEKGKQRTMGQKINKQKDGRFKPNHSNNRIKYQCSEHLN